MRSLLQPVLSLLFFLSGSTKTRKERQKLKEEEQSLQEQTRLLQEQNKKIYAIFSKYNISLPLHLTQKQPDTK